MCSVILLARPCARPVPINKSARGTPLYPLAFCCPLCCCAAAAADDNSIKSCTLSLCVNLSVWHVVRSHFYCRHCFSAHTHTHKQSRAEHTHRHTHIVTLHVRFVPFLSLGFSSLDNALHGSLHLHLHPSPPPSALRLSYSMFVWRQQKLLRPTSRRRRRRQLRCAHNQQLGILFAVPLCAFRLNFI